MNPDKKESLDILSGIDITKLEKKFKKVVPFKKN